MKIIMINGSPRTYGTTGQLLAQIEHNLKQLDPTLTIKLIHLGKMNIQPCNGCLDCYKTGTCFLQADTIEALSQSIEDCDGLVLASPTYACNVSGHFKTFIDRGHFVFEQLLKNKACFSLITYENYGGKKAQTVMKNLIHLSGGGVSSKYLFKANHNQKITNTIHPSLAKLCQKFLNQVKKDHPLSFPERIYNHLTFHMGIKPHAYKNAPRYQGVINRWIERGIVKRGAVNGKK